MQTVHFGRWFARAADLQRKNQTWDGWQLNYRSMQQENQFRKEFWKLVPNNARIVYGYDAHRTNELVLAQDMLHERIYSIRGHKEKEEYMKKLNELEV